MPSDLLQPHPLKQMPADEVTAVYTFSFPRLASGLWLASRGMQTQWLSCSWGFPLGRLPWSVLKQVTKQGTWPPLSFPSLTPLAEPQC